MGPIGEIPILIRGDYSRLIADLNVAENLARDAGVRFSQSFASSATSAGLALTGALTIPLTALGSAAVKANADMDALKRGLVAVTGSAVEANRQFERLQEVAKLPGLGFKEAVQGAVNLQAAGYSAQFAERALLGFGNALASVGRGRAELDRVIIQLQQMATKPRVLMEDLKPLAQLVPQISTIMRDMWGTMDPKELAARGISARDFVQSIVTELEKLPKVTGGIKNAFENLGDSMDRALNTIGQNIAPMVESFITNAAEPLLDFVTNLSPAAQAAGIAVAGLAAVAGPSLLVIGQMVQSFAALESAMLTAGVTWGALATTAGTLASGLGLIAVGVAGIHFSEIDKDALTFFDSLKRNIPGIVSLFSELGSAIRITAAMLELIGIPMRSFLDTVQRFASGMNLGTAFRAISPQIRALHDLLVGAASAMEYLGGNYKSMAQAAEANLQRLSASNRDFETTVAGLTQRHNENLAILEKIPPVLRNYGGAQDEAAKGTKKHADAAKEAVDPWTQFGEAMRKAAGFGEEYLPTAKDIVEATREIATAAMEAAQGMAAFTGILDDAPDFAGTRPGSPDLSDMRKKYPDLFGVNLPGKPEEVKETTRRTQELSKAAKEVSTIINDMVRGIARAIIDWDGFGKVAKKTLESIGEAITRNIIAKVMESTKIVEKLTSVITGALSKIPGLGSIFGSAGSAAGSAAGQAAGGAAGAAGSAGGAASGAAGAASGAMGMVNMISGAASAISGVIGNFQFRAMNKALDNIVKHTLQTANDLANLREDDWMRETHLMLKLDDIWNEIRNVVAAILRTGDGLGEAIEEIEGASEAIAEAGEVIEESSAEAGAALEEVAESASSAAPEVEALAESLDTGTDSSVGFSDSLISLSEATGTTAEIIDDLGASVVSAADSIHTFQDTIHGNIGTIRDLNSQINDLRKQAFNGDASANKAIQQLFLDNPQLAGMLDPQGGGSAQELKDRNNYTLTPSQAYAVAEMRRQTPAQPIGGQQNAPRTLPQFNFPAGTTPEGLRAEYSRYLNELRRQLGAGEITWKQYTELADAASNKLGQMEMALASKFTGVNIDRLFSGVTTPTAPGMPVNPITPQPVPNDPMGSVPVTVNAVNPSEAAVTQAFVGGLLRRGIRVR